MHLAIQKIVGFGGNSRVYLARVSSKPNDDPRPNDIPEGMLVALKQVPTTNHAQNPTLRHEACACLLLRGHPSIPRVLAWGRSNYFEYLAMELLGSGLDDLAFYESRNSTHAHGPCHKPLSTRNLVALIVQMLSVLKYVHAHGFIHGDVKPGNFILGRDDNAGRLYIIDFGLAAPYRDRKTGLHVAPNTLPSLRGTSVYASINMHMHCTPSRRDDMESLAYTIARLLRGRLPWRDDVDDPQELFRNKQAWSGPTLCAGYPVVFGDFVEYTRRMGFEETPDYARWSAEFLALVPGLSPMTLYDEADCSQPHVGFVRSEAGPNLRRVQMHHSPASVTENPPRTNTNDMMIPAQNESWPSASDVPPENVLYDEARMVGEHLARIVSPPETPENRPYLLYPQREVFFYP